MTLIEDLLHLPFPKTVKISPNAQQVLYSTAAGSLGSFKKGDHEQYILWLAESGKPNSSRPLTSGEYGDCEPRWHPDGESVAFISDRAKQSEQWAIWMLPTKPDGDAYPLTPAEYERSISRFEFSPDGKTIAFISANEKTAEAKAKEKAKDDAMVWGEDWTFNRLRLVDVATKQVTTLVSREAHVIDFAWNEDGTQIVFAETQTSDIESPLLDGMRISTVDVSSREIRDLCTFPMDIEHLHWAGETIYFIGRAYPQSAVSGAVVYTIDLASKTASYERYAHGEEDCAWQLGKAGKDMTIKVQHGMEDQIRMLGGKTLFSRKQEIYAWDAAFTKDSDEVLLAVALSDASHPMEIYTTTASGGAMVQLSNHAEKFLAEHGKLGNATLLRCRSADDKADLDGVYYTPTHSNHTKPLPTVLWIHGGPYMRVTETFEPSYFMWVPMLLAAGYGVLCPNYRGSSGRGEDFAAYIRGAAGTVDYDDIITLTQHAVEEGYADKERLVVSGYSQGGFLSFLSIVRNGLHSHGWKFKAAIPGAGVSDGATMTMTSDFGAFQDDLMGKAPWQSEKDDVSCRAGSAIWEFKAAVDKGDVIPPMLILHGEKDARVPLEQSVGFRRALEQAKLPFEMVVYPREGHLFKEKGHIADMAERVVKFVDKHIGEKS